ncbi:hypothetical protein RRG08_040050 [Elysia crispata]|uniref:Uncharacterized protein n=1 Tax=Elysia crispata TaxID=231223 RepID=A0AAE0XUZ5_9GAST|nr:hypothetical protein RRG08_040050 [Elysia crispata]
MPTNDFFKTTLDSYINKPVTGAMKVAMLTALLLSAAVPYTSGPAVFRDIFIWRNNNLTCPYGAVCADVFDIFSVKLLGTTYTQRRVLHSCLCDVNQICPVNDPKHRVYASKFHTRYICQSTCSLEWCSNFQNVFPLITVYTGQEFMGATYNKMNCLCPRHISPAQGWGRYYRSVRAHAYYWDPHRKSYLLVYACNGGQGSQGYRFFRCAW